MRLKYNIFRQRLFLLFLAIAAGLWYVNKLSRIYKTEVTIPLVLVSDYNSAGWVEAPSMKVRCLVEGAGNDLLRYNLGLASALNISLASLGIEATSKEGYYKILPESLRESMKIKPNDLQIIKILDTIPWVRIDKMVSVTLPIKNNVEIFCKKQFMVVGQVLIQPASITVQAPKSVIDTLQYIQTEHLVYTNINKSVNIGVDLVIPPEVIVADQQVRLMADIEGYTELEYTIHVDAENLPFAVTMISIPSQIVIHIKVPMKSLKAVDITPPTATIDYNERTTLRSNQFKIKINNLPMDAVVTSISPEYVEPFFTKN